ncbi:MAG: XRE family transcriptional regulator [Enterococcus faecium]|uniref:XRE family transcriptional regulator n=1 Tax=Enterococcus mundtii TaxID=53346 RepID=A0A2T5DAY2_ENTMU|nr:helix-turn-helix transcriptional regulator [Enterococcus mundtii]MBE6173207.1 XRE family transcriptional regulator [Enterococcus faecium]PTO34784.1 XRE family transcriptional regulator [Enterococcus mundtii]
MKPDAIEVGRRIKEIRTNLGYSMSQFGELISNSPKTTVNNWERGINLPKEDKLKKIALLGKITTNELLHGSPEEFIKKIVVDHFRLQLNPLFIQQIILFLKKQKIDLYDEMTIIEFIQGIFDSGSLVEEESTYLSYNPVIGYDNLYLASETTNEEIGAPIFYVYVERKMDRIHYLPFTFSEHQQEPLYTLPSLSSQLEIDYYTRQFPLLDVELKESMIVYYGIKKEDNTDNVIQYKYDDQKKSYSINQKKYETNLYNPFQDELEKMVAYFDREH